MNLNDLLELMVGGIYCDGADKPLGLGVTVTKIRKMNNLFIVTYKYPRGSIENTLSLLRFTQRYPHRLN